MTRSIAIVATVLFLAAGCGGGSSGPTGDLAPDPGDADGTDGDLAATADAAEVRNPGELPPLPEGPSILMSLREEPPMLPFPWDWHAAGADTATGLRLRVSGPLHSNALIQPVANMFAEYLPHTELQDGFGAIGMVALPLSAAPGPLPAVSGAGELVEVRRLSDGADLPFRVEYSEYEEAGEIVRRLVELDPVYPVPEGERYLVLVRDGLEDAGGAALERTPLAEVVLGLRVPYGPMAWQNEMVRVRERTLEGLAALDEAPDPEELLLALHYTTGTSIGEVVAAADQLLGMDVEVDLDPDGDGVDNVTPGAEHPSFANHPQVGLVVEGVFHAPDFRDAEDILRVDDNGQPMVQGTEPREFWLLVPAEPAGGPWPFATAQHGLNSWKETMYSWGRNYASMGIASGCFDVMFHGQGEDGGFWFLALDRPRVLADNFRQSALDQIAFVRAVDAVIEELDLDVSLDRVAYTGHSLGAILSSLACPLADGDRIGGLVNGGGDFMHLIKGAFENMGLYDALPGSMWAGFRVLAGHVTAGSDPANLGRHLMLEPLGDRSPCPFQLQVSLHDLTVPARTGYELAVAAEAPLIEPALEAWDWLTPTAPDGQTWGVLQFDGGHELFNGGDGPEKKVRAQGVFFHYVETFFETGTPEIVWPGA